MKRAWLFALLLSAGLASADNSVVTLASTTSTENSGLLDSLLPVFEAESGIDMRVVVAATGRATSRLMIPSDFI